MNQKILIRDLRTIARENLNAAGTIAQQAVNEIVRLQTALDTTNTLYDLALAAGHAASDEIERLQAELEIYQILATEAAARFERTQTELETMRTWKTPPYSEAQLQQFEDSCYEPPSQVIRWRFLPEVPEIPPTEHRVNVWGCIVRDGFEECARVQHLDINEQQYWQDRNGDGTITVRCFIELPTQAPPKPLGKVAPLDFGETATCCGCEELIAVGEVKNET